MRRFLSFLLLMLASAALAPGQVLAQLDVLYIHSDSGQPTWVADVQAKLLGAPINTVGLFDAGASTPTLEQLQDYDAVLVSNNVPYADRTTLGNVLAAYIEAGGGVVTAVFATSGVANSNPGGNFTQYALIPFGSATTGSATLGTVAVPSHPIMQGVTSFNGGTSGFRPATTSINPGATLVASWSTGQPLVVARENVGPANVRRVDLGFFPPSSDAFGSNWVSSTDGDLLMRNALIFVAGGGDAPLPVELSGFSGSAARGAVSLSWTTASERDNAGFTVLRDGVEIASFRSTAALRGHGTTAQASRYGYTDARVNTGRAYTYTLRSVDVSGQTHDYAASVEVTVPVGQVTAFALSPASPNPFNPTTSLALSLPQSAEVTATLYNALGQPVRSLHSGSMAAGTSALTVQADGLPSGAYLVRVVAQSADGARYLSSQRVTLVK